jgi:hypothetical protein
VDRPVQDGTRPVRLYENLGFTLRRRMVFSSLRTPVRP